MSEGNRLTLDQAEQLAAKLVKLLEPVCERVEVAGSIRRKKPDIGDVESREISVLDYIRAFVERKGYPPTIREIGEGVGVASPSQVSFYLGKLEAAGSIRRDARVSRGIVINQER